MEVGQSESPLHQLIACCNSAQPVRATTQPTRLPIRCNSASRVATALSRFVRRRNQHRDQSVATAHRGLQQRSAGSCDDATNTAAHPLQQRIACCNCAQQVRATTQPTRLPIRCNSASRVATALSRFVRRRNIHGCPSVATAHRGLQRRSVRQRSTAAPECSRLLQRVACCSSE